MAKIDVLKLSGQSANQVELNEKIFNARINKRLLEDIVRMYGQNKRTGLAHTKGRAEVRGGGKKPWKQKGTGRARHSSIRSPIWRGGGTVFGPRRREILYSIPEQLRKQALISALSYKAQQKQLVVVEKLEVSEPKTKQFAKALVSLKLSEQRVVCAMGEASKNLEIAARNIQDVNLKRATDLNAYHIMRYPKLVLDVSALQVLEKRLLGESKAALKKTVTAKKASARRKTKKEAVSVS